VADKMHLVTGLGTFHLHIAGLAFM
jgi:hypothetical protein